MNETVIAGPASALCATCGCCCGGQPVTVNDEYNRVLGRAVATYRHASTEGCDQAREQSDAFWSNADVRYALQLAALR